MANKELSELQSELETLKEKNKQEEVNLLMEQGVSREKVHFLSRLYDGNDRMGVLDRNTVICALSLRLKKWEDCSWPSIT